MNTRTAILGPRRTGKTTTLINLLKYQPEPILISSPALQITRHLLSKIPFKKNISIIPQYKVNLNRYDNYTQTLAIDEFQNTNISLTSLFNSPIPNILITSNEHPKHFKQWNVISQDTKNDNQYMPPSCNQCPNNPCHNTHMSNQCLNHLSNNPHPCLTCRKFSRCFKTYQRNIFYIQGSPSCTLIKKNKLPKTRYDIIKQ